MKNRHRYTHDWFSVVRPTILVRDKFRCSFCQARQGSKGYYDQNQFIELLDDFMTDWAQRRQLKIYKIYLQVMHLDQDVNNNTLTNLAAGCARCHLKYDNKYKPPCRVMAKPK